MRRDRVGRHTRNMAWLPYRSKTEQLSVPERTTAMLTAQFNEDVLVVRPDGPITSEDVTALLTAATGYLATHRDIPGVMIQTRRFPGFTTPRALGDYVRFVLRHRTRVRRIAL